MFDSIPQNLALKCFPATLALTLLWVLPGPVCAELVLPGAGEGEWREARSPLQIEYRQTRQGLSKGAFAFLC